MAYRSDATGERLHISATLPNPATTGLTVMGWFRVRVDRDEFSTYWRTSSGGGTLNTVATGLSGFSVNVFTTSGNLVNTYSNVLDEWVHIAVVDNAGSITQYVTPSGGSIVSQSGTIGSGTPDHLCICGRASGDASEWFNGAAAYVRVFAAALTQVQVATERDSPTAVLTEWADWPLSTGTDLVDASGNGRNLTAVAAGGSTEAGPLGAVVTGVVVVSLGALGVAVTGTRDRPGTTAVGLGSLTVVVVGTRTVPGVVTVGLGALTTTVTGTRATTGTVAVALGGLTVAAARTTTGQVTVSLGALTAVLVGTGEAPTVTGGGGWYSLASIIRESRAERRALENARPLACPHDGEPLTGGRGGVLFCQFDGWRTDG